MNVRVSEREQEKSSKIPFERRHTTPGVHPYDNVSWKKFDTEIAGSGFSQKGVEFPAFWSEDSVRIVASKYFYTWDDEGREHSLKQLLDRIVDTITKAGKLRGYFASEEDAEIFNHELKYLMLHQRFAFNSPVWFNIGTPERQQASACFINSVDDDMDSIMQLATDEANIFKLGSGAGVNLSSIRSRGEGLTGGGEASGPVSFMKGFDAFAGVIKSGGKKRRAAKMVILNDDHPDIEEFIWSKSKEEKKAYDLIDAGHSGHFDAEDGAYASVFFQNANHSVRVSDAFMETVKNDESWELVNRRDGAVSREVSARELFGQIAKAAWECGDPGLQFDDTIHAWHTAKNTGRQHGSNPCSEYLFLDDTACNLASFNLLKYLLEDGTFDIEAFEHGVQLAIVAQDILVDHADYPNERIDKGTRRWRTLGLGYANLGAYLMSKGIPYDSDAGRNIAASITSLMGATAYYTSSVIAERLEPFDGYEENQEPMRRVILEHLNYAGEYAENEIGRAAYLMWDNAYKRGEHVGYRNAQVTVLAPTGTISFAMDCDTTGLEPAIGLVSYKSLVGGGTMKLVNKTVLRALRALNYGDSEIHDIVAYIEKHGTIEGAPPLLENDLPVFDCAFTSREDGRSISWKGHVDMMAAVQPFLSGAISKTVNLPNDATVKDIEEAYMYAWEHGIKAIAVYRDGCKRSQPLSTKEGGEQADTPVAETQEPKPRKKLPDTRQSITHKFKVGGQKGYFTVGLYDDGTPGELFVVMNKEGSTISGLMDAFATAISIALQYGAPLDDLVSKFKYTNFEPAGFTQNPEIRKASSVVDYIFQWLEDEFRTKPDMTEAANKIREALDTQVVSDLEPVASTYDAPLCVNCGNQTQRSGACYACPVCGETTGCG